MRQRKSRAQKVREKFDMQKDHPEYGDAVGKRVPGWTRKTLGGYKGVLCGIKVVHATRLLP